MMKTAFVVAGVIWGSGALPPVPLAAGDASVVTPDHLAWLRVPGSRLTMRHGVEVLVAGGSDQSARIPPGTACPRGLRRPGGIPPCWVANVCPGCRLGGSQDDH